MAVHRRSLCWPIAGSIAATAILLLMAANPNAVDANPAGSLPGIGVGANASAGVIQVGKPFPAGAYPGGQISVTVVAYGLSTVRLFLSPGPDFPGREGAPNDDVPIGTGRGEMIVRIPSDTAPGLYFVKACVAKKCKTSPGTIQVAYKGVSEPIPPTQVLANPPFTEFFPEDPSSGMRLGDTFDCPISAHGQWPSDCQYVYTNAYTSGFEDHNGYYYCSTTHKYPYKVFSSDDPLWDDLSIFPSVAQTFKVSNSKYAVDSGINRGYSYSGKDPSDSAGRGYVWFRLTTDAQNTNAQAWFLCSNKPQSD
jgi:hypothetical protein